MRTLLLAIVLALPSIASAENLATLCVAGERCVNSLDVKAADEARVFTWTDRTERVVVLGVVKPKAVRVMPEGSAALRLRLSARDAGRWPSVTKLVIRGPAQRVWQIDFARADAAKSWILRAGPGDYEVAIEALRLKRSTLKTTIAAGATTELTATLEPLPLIDGRVVTRKDSKVIAGAAISGDSGEVIAISDGQGRFSFDADPEQWPSSLRITAAGYGVVVLPVPRARLDTSLGDIALGRGARLHVTVEQEQKPAEITLNLFKRNGGKKEENSISSARTRDSALLSDINAGDYLLLMSGTHPGEQLGVSLSLKEGEERELNVPIKPRQFAIHAEMGGSPLTDARINLSCWDGHWHEALQADADGKSVITVWQLGRFSAMVWSESRLTTPHVEQNSFTDDDVDWTIQVPSRELAGSVIDAVTKKPIPNASVGYRNASGSVGSGDADADGRFVFTALRSGEHTIMASADGYRFDSVKYLVPEAEQRNEVTIALRRGDSVTLTVNDAAGRPIAGAEVLDYAGFKWMGKRITDSEGRVEIGLPPEETRDVFVIPRDGSIGYGSIALAQKEVIITVPNPQSTVIVQTESADHEPIANVWVVMRYNGIAIPFEVQQATARMQGAQPVSGSDGRIVLRHMPAGIYEFWPVGSPAEVRSTIFGIGPEAPAKIVAQPGMNTAILTFQNAR